jgi:hypothetical protein
MCPACWLASPFRSRRVFPCGRTCAGGAGVRRALRGVRGALSSRCRREEVVIDLVVEPAKKPGQRAVAGADVDRRLDLVHDPGSLAGGELLGGRELGLLDAVRELEGTAEGSASPTDSARDDMRPSSCPFHPRRSRRRTGRRRQGRRTRSFFRVLLPACLIGVWRHYSSRGCRKRDGCTDDQRVEPSFEDTDRFAVDERADLRVGRECRPGEVGASDVGPFAVRGD